MSSVGVGQTPFLWLTSAIHHGPGPFAWGAPQETQHFPYPLRLREIGWMLSPLG